MAAKNGVGLFCNSTGFNVAMTRAQSLLVCVGDPCIWRLDPLWSALLAYAMQHNSYLGWRGTPCPPEDDALHGETGLWGSGAAAPGVESGAARPLAVVSGSSGGTAGVEPAVRVAELDGDAVGALHAGGVDGTGADLDVWRPLEDGDDESDSAAVRGLLAQVEGLDRFWEVHGAGRLAKS